MRPSDDRREQGAAHPDPEVLALERIAARGWCGTVEFDRDGWLYRAAEGFTGRANSVLPWGVSNRPLEDALADVRDFYAGHGLRPLFQMPQCPQTDALDTALDRRGWVAFNPTAVMVADLTTARDAARQASAGRAWPTAQVADQPSPEWLAGYLYRGAALPATAVAVLTSGPGPVFATLTGSAGRVAVARAVVADGWLGVTAVTVEESARRSGAGTAVMADLLDWGSTRGADRVYLQVARDNHAAQALYGRLGFVDHHGYHYRRPRD